MKTLRHCHPMYCFWFLDLLQTGLAALPNPQ